MVMLHWCWHTGFHEQPQDEVDSGARPDRGRRNRRGRQRLGGRGLDADGPAHGLHEVFARREAEPQSPVFPRRALVHLKKIGCLTF
jgi:hypothetical protein